MRPEAWVISLKRTPERLKRFHQINGQEASGVIVIEGIVAFAMMPFCGAHDACLSKGSGNGAKGPSAQR